MSRIDCFRAIAPRSLVLSIGLLYLAAVILLRPVPGMAGPDPQRVPFDALTPECLAELERVYWEARIWPTANDAPRPDFEQTVAPDTFERRVHGIRIGRERLRDHAIEIDAAAVQIELQRMVRNSQAPERLQALFRAMGDDPSRIADCLVRPILIDRALRRLESAKGSGSIAAAVPPIERDAAWTPPALQVGNGSLRQGPPSGDAWQSTARLPDGRRNHVSVWTGAEMLVWGGAGLNNQGGRYDPATDSWRAITLDGEPDHRRRYATAVWTGSEMVVWGGWGFDASDNVLDTGGAYDPVADAWREVNPVGAPSPRAFHTAVWSGNEMLVWGGCPALLCDPPIGSGAAWNPATNDWRPIAGAGSPPARGIHTAVWTGTRMLIWGGCDSFNCAVPRQDGASYDPVGDAWTTMSQNSAPAARFEHTAVWSGEAMLVWGGELAGGFADTGARYDPDLDVWSPMTSAGAPTARRFHTAVWSDATGEMIVWGGCIDSECSQSRATGGRYDPDTDLWHPTSATGAASSRSHHTAVWSGAEMIVWGGCGLGECQVIRQSGARYDPVLDSWQPTADPGEPSARLDHTAVWTGAEMIVFGGVDGSGFTLTGSEYDPATDTWSALPVSGTAGQRTGHSAVWTGTEMIVWGGRSTSIGPTSTGAIYDPIERSWAEVPSTGAPAARAYHGSVWTGDEMVVFGGCAFSDCALLRGDGGAFDPASGTWRPMSPDGAPSPRFLHSVDWNGSDVLIWGGQDASGNALGDGALWAPSVDAWMPMNPIGAPSIRARHTAIWTGSALLIWGGRDSQGALGDGAAYDTAVDAWTPLPAGVGAPLARHGHTAVWTGTEMIVWGGCLAVSCDAFNLQDLTSTGSVYHAASDEWLPMTTTSAPFPRENHTAIWASDHMVVWGGWRGFVQTDTGGRYRRPDPAGVIFSSGFESAALR